MKNKKAIQAPICFVIMPFSDVETYEKGHFDRVYKEIIEKACKKAKLRPVLAKEPLKTNHIMLEVIKNLLTANIVICDVSSKNPNVLYELGIRHAFNLPVTIIRDMKTPRVFDLQELRDVEYDESLRADKVREAINGIATNLKNTLNLNDDDINSPIQFLNLAPARFLSHEDSTKVGLTVDVLNEITKKLSRIEDAVTPPHTKKPRK
jgi:hypothetical protein